MGAIPSAALMAASSIAHKQLPKNIRTYLLPILFGATMAGALAFGETTGHIAHKIYKALPNEYKR
jgi:hypothetical protein